MPLGDRFDLRGAAVGVAVLLALGFGLHDGWRGWAAGAAFGAAAMNITAAAFRQRVRPITGDQFRRRLRITVPFTLLIVVVSAGFGVALGKHGAVPAAIVGGVLAFVMVMVMIRGDRARKQR